MHAVNTDRAPKAIGPYSQAIEDGNLIFTSGQLPIDPSSGELSTASISEASRIALTNLRAVLTAAGSDMSRVIKTTVFLKDMGDFQEFNRVYAEFFKEPFPARSCVQAACLPKNSLIEIEAVARK